MTLSFSSISLNSSLLKRTPGTWKVITSQHSPGPVGAGGFTCCHLGNVSFLLPRQTWLSTSGDILLPFNKPKYSLTFTLLLGLTYWKTHNVLHSEAFARTPVSVENINPERVRNTHTPFHFWRKIWVENLLVGQASRSTGMTSKWRRLSDSDRDKIDSSDSAGGLIV